jgi:hypothetical protein
MYGELSYFTAQRFARLEVVENKKRLRKGEIDVVTQCVPRVRFPAHNFLSFLWFICKLQHAIARQSGRQTGR